MDTQRIYMITDLEGFSPNIARLVSMMNYARWTTLQAVENLSVNQLDFQLDEESNSIGALLLHIAATEYSYYVATLSGRHFSEEDRQSWWTAMMLGPAARDEIKHHELDFYLDKLHSVRLQTLAALREKTDEWLDQYEIEPYLGNRPVNNHYKWFHVMEDEINHRGQIRLIRRRIVETASV